MLTSVHKLTLVSSNCFGLSAIGMSVLPEDLRDFIDFTGSNLLNIPFSIVVYGLVITPAEDDLACDAQSN